jgi:hypothetical protein
VERKLVSSWLLLLALPALALAFALLAPGLWSKSGKWILPLVLGVSVVLVFAITFLAVAILLRMGKRILKRERP